MNSRITLPITSGNYIADPALETAAKVAMELGQPLLLTGEPGTGKTKFAGFLANSLAPQWLKLPHPLPLHKFETKSTSVATDLFYRFDSLRRLHASHDPTMSRLNRDYISFEALGTAILLTQPWDKVSDIVPREEHTGSPVRSVVLIDEIDKAPRDFPNDILNEIDQDMYFKIPELQAQGRGVLRVDANPVLRPIVVLTSNSEKNLPAAFLRRCVFHHIEFPEREFRQRMTDIVVANLTECRHGRLTEEAIDFFYVLREDPSVEKPPATAELVQWVKVLHGLAKQTGNGDGHDQPLAALKLDAFVGTLGVLAKNVDDLRGATRHARRFF